MMPESEQKAEYRQLCLTEEGGEGGMSFETYEIKNKNEKAIPALYKKNVNKNLTEKTYTLRVKRAFCRHSLQKPGKICQIFRVRGSITV